MKLSPTGLAFIQHYEGFSATIYHCPAGIPTIGYGHVVHGALAHAEFAGGITKEEARVLLREDVAVAERAVRRLIAAKLTQNQFDALVSFTFNLGSGALERSALRRAVNRGDHEAVPAQLLRWVWAGGKRLPGLIRRRMAEGALYSRQLTANS